MQKKFPSKVLFVDDDSSVVTPVANALDKMGVEIFVASDLQTAMYRFNKQFFKIIFIDMNFGELDALSLIQKWRNHEVKEKRTAAFIIMNSAPLKPEQKALMSELKDIEVVQKPLALGPMITQLKKSHGLQIRKDLKEKLKHGIRQDFEKSGDLDQAIQRVKECQKALGDDYFTMLIELYNLKGSYEEGLELLKKMPDKLMDPLQKFNLMGEFSLKIGKFEESKQFYEKADKIAPGNIDRITNMVDVYLALKEPESAIEKQKDIIECNPENPDIKFELFKKLEDASFADEAADFCRESTMPKEVIKYFNNKGVMMVKTEAIKNAIAEYERALNYYPNNKDNYLIHFNIALAYLKLRDPQQVSVAIDHLKSSMEINPQFEKAKSVFERVQRASAA
ncbi:response regulator [Pseudobacteriovorax antillogorgiicola]|uniref:Tetratricopeptide repeat-containing protein n=1 Tax=Pseudobacteriovorax antillogorgiicola TaxID=1513793 RepID=A0A1Y6BTE6_9BACT|nr:response regulator [Pseudobacteriovorax antillogorgiicola]TCS53040.1 tetratricopeptide repeat protein [Pseudobacteriovorax antillogorgiicola]SMF26524.1 Tetratricopeptide repeat-containing protein [Pseudobacteriovorax antillogorgiicola]